MLLKERILSTLRFFDLQDFPLTLLELHKYLLPDLESLNRNLDSKRELIGEPPLLSKVGIIQILSCLGAELFFAVESEKGFYCLKGRKEIIKARLENYLYGIQRERRLRRFASGLRHIPFVRGAALAGSQALGPQRAISDIDLLIITDPKFLWTARTLVTAYFQFFGVRRHGQNIANRFCLNHYLSGPKVITKLKNLYTASEYIKLRPLAYPQATAEFQEKNRNWIAYFFPNWEILPYDAQRQSLLQKILEKWLNGFFGEWLERKLKNWQLPKIRQEAFIIVEENELSFHPHSKQQGLLEQFFSVK